MNSDRISIPTFRGQNFEFWKSKLFTFLEANGLAYTLRQDAATETAVNRRSSIWIEDDAKARLHILEAVDDEHVAQIMDKSSARAMLAKLEGTYMQPCSRNGVSFSKRKLLRDQFLALKMSEEEDACEYLHRFQVFVDRLADYGDLVSPADILACLQLSMPKSYKHVFDELDPELKSQAAVDTAKAKIMAEYCGRRDAAAEGAKAEPPAAAHKKTAGGGRGTCNAIKDEAEKCYRCGESGHWARSCTQSKLCYRCDQQGHLSFQCTERESSQPHSDRRPLMTVNDRVLPRTKPITLTAMKFRKTYGMTTVSRRLNNAPTASRPGSPPSAATLLNKLAAVDKWLKDTADTVFWILDSRASYHMICDELLFSKCVCLEKPMYVEVAAGRILSATKVGEVRAAFQIGGRTHVKVLSDVYLVNAFEQNLLSIQRLVQFGGSVVLKSSEVQLRDATNELLAAGKKIENLYVLKSCLEKPPINSVLNDTM